MFIQSLVLLGLAVAGQGSAVEEKAMSVEIKRTTPILVVEAIEPSLPFWDILGFEKTMEVPDGDVLGFVAVQNGSMEIMLQSLAMVVSEAERQGLPEIMKTAGQQSILYVEVTDLKEVRDKLAEVEGVEILVASRQTSYGAEEAWVREPGGHVVGLAAFE